MPGGGGGQTSSTQVNYPPEYKGLMEAAANMAQQVAGMPYQGYEGQTRADLSPDTLASFDLARQSIGMTDPYYGAALDQLGQYGSYSGLNTATGALDAYGNPDQYSSLQTMSPIVGAIAPQLGASSAGYGQNLLNMYGGNQKFPDAAAEYMSPYTSQVLDEIASRGSRNFTENLQPSINKTFIGGGTFGGKQNQEFINRALRDTQQSILGEQAKALESGYGQAADIFASDQSRLGSQATNLANLYSGDISRTLSAGTNLADLLGKSGSADAQRGIDMSKYLTDLGGADADRSAKLSQMLMDYGNSIYGQNVKDISMLEGLGATEQQQEQGNLDASMAQYADAQNYPKEALSTLIQPLSSFNVQPNTTTTTQSSGGSPLGNILGALVTAGSMAAKSDRRVKKNIKKLGTMKTGKEEYPIYSYKYKGTNEPRMGVMAQDVEKKNPKAVGSRDGVKTVDYQKLAGGGKVEDRLESYLNPVNLEDITQAIGRTRTSKNLRDNRNIRIADNGSYDLPLKRRSNMRVPSEQEITDLINENDLLRKYAFGGRVYA